MRKEDVEVHRDRPFGWRYPAINIKVYSYPPVEDVVAKFECSKETAERALLWAYQAGQMRFFEDIADRIDHFWPTEKLKAFSAGRSGGWLIVAGLKPLERWDAVDLGKWARLIKTCKNIIKYLTSHEYVFEEIEANRWDEEGAEQYNYFDTKEGETKCIVDVKKDHPIP